MARKKKPVRKHTVWGEISNIELTRATSALRLWVYAKGEQIGTLEIGQGSLFWWGQKRHKSRRLSWTEFAAKMDELAYGDK